MSVKVQCANCARQFAAPDDVRGQTLPCPACGAAISVPSAEPMLALGRSKVLDILEDDSKPKQEDTKVIEEARRQAAALGITQRELFARHKSPPPQLVTPEYVPPDNSFFGYVSRHKLVLATAFVALLLLALNMANWRYNNLMISAIGGLLLAAGAWRTQWFGKSESPSAKLWRSIELWVGRVLVILAVLVPLYYFGYVVVAVVRAMFNGGIAPDKVPFIVGVLTGYAIAIGDCVIVFVMGEQHGFFKALCWNFVIVSSICIVALLSSPAFNGMVGGRNPNGMNPFNGQPNGAVKNPPGGPNVAVQVPQAPNPQSAPRFEPRPPPVGADQAANNNAENPQATFDVSKLKPGDQLEYSPTGDNWQLVTYTGPGLSGHTLMIQRPPLRNPVPTPVRWLRLPQNGGAKPAGDDVNPFAVEGDKPAAPVVQRNWSDAAGKFKIDAILLRVDGNNVVLRRADGRQLTVPLDKLSDDDKKYIADFQAGKFQPAP